MSEPILIDRDFDDLAGFVGRCAQSDPARLALISDQRRLTYGALDALMDRVAAALQRDGVASGERVAICAGNSAEYAAVYLGAIRAGAVVAPLPASLDVDSTLRMLDDCRARLVFLDSDTSAALAQPAADRGILVVTLDSSAGAGLETWLAPEGAQPAPVEILPDAPCNIIYSSGTTGSPKGVVQSHAMRWTHVRLGRILGGQATMMVSTPLYSTGGSVSLIMTLGSQGTAVLMRKFDAARFLSLAQANRATHATLVPVQYRRILDLPDFDAFDLSSFKGTFSMAAPSSAELKREILARWPGALLELYGMTEGGGATVLVARDFPDKLHTVGRTGPTNEIRIIGEDGSELPIGEVGEVVGRSGTMMSGYHNLPEETAAAEWRDGQGRRFIRSGDIGRLDEEGFLTILGRKKDMIISGGFNIYPSDLEAVLLRHDQVQDAAVIGAPSDRWGETPVAFVVSKPGEKIDVEALLDWANVRLGKTQRISEVKMLPELPYNSVGKVLKRELREHFGLPPL